MSELEAEPVAGGLQVGFSVILGLAVIGFFVGTGTGPDTGNPLVQHEALAAHADEAPVSTYTQLRASARGDGPGWETDRATLVAFAQGADEVDGGDKSQALAARASNRAYDGAPPTIPHPVRQRAAAECLACHEDGLRLRGKSASAMSHAELASCTQCHVVSEPPMPGAPLPPDATFAVNSFVGASSPTHGARAWAIAPPTIPHATSMRERCDSCHGPEGRSPLRSSHPERQSCTQCHGPSAGLDQAPGGPR